MKKLFISRSRSHLFLMELVVAILFFALCAGICMRVFARASIDLRESERLLASVSNAENAAELYKHYKGDLDLVARVTGGNVAGDILTVYYDESWNRCASCSCVFVMTVIKSGYSELGKAKITVFEHESNRKIFELTVSIYGGVAG